MKLYLFVLFVFSGAFCAAETFSFRGILIEGGSKWKSAPGSAAREGVLKLVADSSQVAIFTSMDVPPDVDREEFLRGFDKGVIQDRKVMFSNPINLSGMPGKLLLLSHTDQVILRLTFYYDGVAYLAAFQSSDSPSNEDTAIQELIRSIKPANE